MSEAVPQASAPQAQEPSVTVRSLWIPLQGLDLLLPNTAVAEISDYEPPQHLDGAPEWLFGLFPWRGRGVPLLSYERLLGLEAEAPKRGSRVVVVNTLNKNPQLPFIGILARAIPRLQQLRDGMLEARTLSEDDSSSIKARVAVDDDEALIPDLDVLEQLLLKHGVGIN